MTLSMVEVMMKMLFSWKLEMMFEILSFSKDEVMVFEMSFSWIFELTLEILSLSKFEMITTSEMMMLMVDAITMIMLEMVLLIIKLLFSWNLGTAIKLSFSLKLEMMLEILFFVCKMMINDVC